MWDRSVIAATYFPSNQVTYENTASGMQATDVQWAIDELYNTCFPPYTPGHGTDVIDQILDKNPDELYTDDHGDIRYYGKSPNNYVSFNNELWRIIGVIDEKIKIIRNESVGKLTWSLEGLEFNNWDYSLLKSYLNGEYYNSVDETYRNMISEETYYLGGQSDRNYDKLTASGFYDVERDSSQVWDGNPTSTTQYIGLMYPSDYGYASGSSCLSTVLISYNVSCKDSNYLFRGVYEWLQTPYADSPEIASLIGTDGSVGGYSPTKYAYEVRPVLYLTLETQITGGDGSQSNLYTIE